MLSLAFIKQRHPDVSVPGDPCWKEGGPRGACSPPGHKGRCSTAEGYWLALGGAEPSAPE